MACRSRLWLDAYYLEELDARRYREVGAHLETCQSCRAELIRVEHLHRLLKCLPSVTPSSDLSTQAVANVRRTWQSSRQPGLPRLTTPLGGVVATVFCLTILYVCVVPAGDRWHRTSKVPPGSVPMAASSPQTSRAQRTLPFTVWVSHASIVNGPRRLAFAAVASKRGPLPPCRETQTPENRPWAPARVVLPRRRDGESSAHAPGMAAGSAGDRQEVA
jgi:anti-sigma factor RsiW